MKRTIVTAMACAAIIGACKSPKPASASKESKEIVSDAQLTAVNARFPGTTKDELIKGHDVYTGACTKCHGTKDITGYTEPRLLEIVDVMAKKAEITDAEKQALIKFAVGVRATK